MQNRKLTLLYPISYLNTRLQTIAIPKQIESLFSRTHIAFLSLVLFGIVTFFGINTQYQFGILYNFSFTNMVILTLSVLYAIILSQYFLLRDNAFWYYALYLLFNIIYAHYAVFFGNKMVSLKLLPTSIHPIAGSIMMSTFLLYTMFATHFLNLKTEYPKFEIKVRQYARLYGLWICSILILPFILHNRTLFIANSIVYILCILTGLWTIGQATIILRGKLAFIFLLGTYCYFIGSILVFIFSPLMLGNPWSNPLMNHPIFFAQVGILFEVIFFSSGLAYRMRLIEIEKKQIEQELLLKKYEELAIEHALLKQRERISHDLHDDVGATLNSIGVFSEIALQQIRQNNAESVPLLERIGEASRHLIDVMNDIVWVVNPENDRFENITMRMRLFVADLLMPKNINIHFVADERLNTVNLSIEQRKHFYLIFKEAVNNVCKYAHCDKLNIHIELCDKDICMRLTDNGQGFDTTHPKKGNGLKSMLKRAAILRGRLTIESQHKKGTQVSLCFPYQEETIKPTELPIRVGQKDRKEAIFVA